MIEGSGIERAVALRQADTNLGKIKVLRSYDAAAEVFPKF